MKATSIALWVVAALLALLMIFAGSTKLMSDPTTVENFKKFGHGEGFLHFIGACEVLGGLGLLIPRVRFWAAVGLIPIMAGAVQTELTHGGADAKHLPAPVIALVLLAVSAYAHRGEWKRFFAKGNLFTGA
jgi:putative oxidoreductase